LARQVGWLRTLLRLLKLLSWLVNLLPFWADWYLARELMRQGAGLKLSQAKLSEAKNAGQDVVEIVRQFANHQGGVLQQLLPFGLFQPGIPALVARLFDDQACKGKPGEVQSRLLAFLPD